MAETDEQVLTLRDRFAIAALQSLMSQKKIGATMVYDDSEQLRNHVAQAAWKIADAALAMRDQH
jgi:hypothetical protein